jgi:hypothetical protein
MRRAPRHAWLRAGRGGGPSTPAAVAAVARRIRRGVDRTASIRSITQPTAAHGRGSREMVAPAPCCGKPRGVRGRSDPAETRTSGSPGPPAGDCSWSSARSTDSVHTPRPPARSRSHPRSFAHAICAGGRSARPIAVNRRHRPQRIAGHTSGCAGGRTNPRVTVPGNPSGTAPPQAPCKGTCAQEGVSSWH